MCIVGCEAVYSPEELLVEYGLGIVCPRPEGNASVCKLRDEFLAQPAARMVEG